MNTARKLKITDSELSKVLTLREMRKALTKKLDKIEQDLKVNETQVIDLIECGCEIDSELNVSIQETEKIYPKYKEEVEKRLGEKVLKEIINSTTPKIFKKLVIN